MRIVDSHCTSGSGRTYTCWTWPPSIAAGVVPAVLAVFIGVSALTGVDAGSDEPTDPGSGQYADG